MRRLRAAKVLCSASSTAMSGVRPNAAGIAVSGPSLTRCPAVLADRRIAEHVTWRSRLEDQNNGEFRNRMNAKSEKQQRFMQPAFTPL